ncbi:unnamed protein product [Alopecurus aequalis]
MAKGAGYGLGFACFAIVAAMAGATQFQVGGNNGWSVPAGAQSYNTWAMKNRFQIGDTLEFVYPNDQDSVLVVQPAAYNACNTSSYDKKFSDGNTVFTLDRAGAFFFISGVDANCRANEKLIVMVLAGRNGNASGGGPSSPAAAPPAPATPPPATSPAPSASSPPPATASPPAPAPKAPSPTSAPPPASVSTPTTPPSSAPAASSPPSAPPSSSPTPSAPADASPMPAPATAPAGADGGSTNSTGAPPPAGSTNQNSAGITVTGAAGFVGSAAACIVGYAMLAL